MIYIEFSDNTTQTIVTNENDWLTSPGPVRENDIYQGEWYDATMETDGWLRPGYNTANWGKVAINLNPKIGVLSSSAIMPKAKKIESYTPIAITQPSEGVFVVDFGQNLAGTKIYK